MIGRLLFMFAVLLPAAAQCFADEPRIRGAGIHCAGLIGDEPAIISLDGSIILAESDACTLSLVNIKGDVGRDATQSAHTEPSEIGGDVDARNCKSVLLQGNVTVGGSLNIDLCNGAAWNVMPAAYQASLVSGPASRTRRLCPYRQQARFSGDLSVIEGVPVASNPAGLADPTKYQCIAQTPPRLEKPDPGE